MDLENRLVELEFLSCEFESMDAFSELYGLMLAECQVLGDKETLQEMRVILMRQACFLMNAWLKEKQAMSPINFVSGLGYGSNN